MSKDGWTPILVISTNGRTVGSDACEFDELPIEQMHDHAMPTIDLIWNYSAISHTHRLKCLLPRLAVNDPYARARRFPNAHSKLVLLSQSIVMTESAMSPLQP